MHLQWLLPGWAWPFLLAAAVGCALWARRAYAGSEPAPGARARAVLIGLRTAACVMVLLAVARPLLIKLQTVREPALVAVVVEDSGSMALRDQPGGPDRWAQALRLAADVDSLLGSQGDGAEMALLRGNGSRPLRATTLQAALADTPRAVGTDLPVLVAQARQSLLARPLGALIVLSDGHSQDQAPPAGPLGLPLWLVGVGDVTGPPDRFLADLRYPDRVQRGEPMIVEVVVGQQIDSGDSPAITVRLLHDGEVVDARTGPGADLTRWELIWKPEDAGLALLEVEVTPLVNERFLQNNRATLAVDVLQDRSRVLVLAPAPGWDLRFLIQAARQQTGVELSVVRPGPAGPVLADTGQQWRTPETVELWRDSWDAVVLFGPPGALLSDEGRTLRTAVQQGLGILSIAGDPATDLHPRPWPSALRAILPVELRDDRPRSGDWSIRAAPGAVRHAILSGITYGVGADGVLAAWPPLRQLQIVDQRVQAEVLLNAGADHPLLVASAQGEGRSLWFGGRRLWELAFWRLPSATTGAVDVPAAGTGGGGRLMQQMLLWTALGDQTAGLALLGHRLVYEEGEHVPVAVRWLDLRAEPVVGRPVAVEVARPDGTDARIHALPRDPLRPGVGAGELPPLPPGRWRLTPVSAEMPPEAGPAREIVVTAAERELTQVRQDRRNLRQTAARLGGAALDAGNPEHVQRLLAELTDLDLGPRHTQRQSRLEPAAGWVWFAIVALLLAAEWLLRRRHGLL